MEEWKRKKEIDVLWGVQFGQVPVTPLKHWNPKIAAMKGRHAHAALATRVTVAYWQVPWYL